MPPTPSAAESNPLVRALLADLGLEEGGIDLAVDPEDEMLEFLVQSHAGDRDRALYGYFQSGASIAESMAQVLRWRFGEPRRIGRLLDFASGYGRVTRFLLTLLPPARLWVSDVYAAGVRFQERRFGVHGIVSTVRPEEFPAAAGHFDAILVTSLFTHLPAERFIAWLRVLTGMLSPGGVLAFSVHDRSLLPPGVELPAEGLLFQEISESGSLAGSDYGSTWVSEEFVRGALRQALGGAAGGASAAGSLHRLPRGLCNFQDLYVAVPEAGADFSGLVYRGEPHFFLERCELTAPDRLELRGWAGPSGCGALAAVEVLLDGQPLARLAIDADRPDVAELLADQRLMRSGWGGSCLVPPGTSRSASVFGLRVVDDRGAAHPQLACTLEAALLDSSQREVGYLHSEVRRAEQRAAGMAHQVAALEARIAAMEASRFWKLRNQWFRFKGWLGVA